MDKVNTQKNKILITIVAKLAFLTLIVFATNPGVVSRLVYLWGHSRFETLIPFCVIWGVTLVAIFAAAFNSRFSVRLVWGILIAFSTAVTYGYYRISGSGLSIFDVISLWNERHEANRAAGVYQSQIVFGALVFAALLAVMLWPTSSFKSRWQKIVNWAAMLPFIPVAMIATIFWLKNGTTDTPMPSQFNSLSLASILAVKLSTQNIPDRGTVTWSALPLPGKRNIIMLVDESLRGDYLNFLPNNPYTPHFAALADKFTNFGPAVSGGDCSNYSNSLLRFGVSRMDIVGSANSNPSLFDYAKHAGFRTVYIDAQAKNITNGNMLQNFMSMREKQDIDAFYPIRDVQTYEADSELARVMAKELDGDKPVFIYANKNGTHFPYDTDYPASSTVFHPSLAESGTDTPVNRVASYRNAVAWTVDKFMADFFASADLSHTTMIYTSDHGQALVSGSLTHCEVINPNPRMGLVPLLAYSSEPELRAKFEHGASQSKGKASHFQIASTLYELMGYAPADIAKKYDESLFIGTSRASEMTTGDIFGIFGNHVNLTPIDASQNYLESEATN